MRNDAVAELSEQITEKEVGLAPDPAGQVAKVNRYAFHFMADCQKVILDEMLFAGNTLLDRAFTERHLFNEFLSKMSEARSVKDISAMYQQCAKHQLDFIQRDTERLLKHGEHIIDNTRRLVDSLDRN